MENNLECAAATEAAVLPEAIVATAEHAEELGQDAAPETAAALAELDRRIREETAKGAEIITGDIQNEQDVLNAYRGILN